MDLGSGEHCLTSAISANPRVSWLKHVSVNDAPMISFSATVRDGDTVQIVDRVSVAYTAPVGFTLVVTWTEALDLVGWTGDTGSVGQAGRTLTWRVTGQTPATWHTLTKTFHVLAGPWDTGLVSESLAISNTDPQPASRVVRLQHLRSIIRYPRIMRGYR